MAQVVDRFKGASKNDQEPGKGRNGEKRVRISQRSQRALRIGKTIVN